MRLLLTNDDGYECEGILALADALEKDHEVWVMAPDSERSGTSHAMTLKNASKVKQVAERRFTCSGMPADCVILSALGMIPVKIDAVISGINRGPNLGTDLIYSGTAAAARQASLMGMPGIAVSLASLEPPFHFEAAARFVSENLEEFVGLWKPDTFLNVNIPNKDALHEGYSQARASRRMYTDRLRRFTAPDGTVFCFLADGHIETEPEEGTDWWMVERGKVSLSRVKVCPECEETPNECGTC
jgi:5'-nucleotidase